MPRWVAAGFLLAGFLAIAEIVGADAPLLKDVVFHADFDGAGGLSGWEGAGQPGIQPQQRAPASKCLYVERPAAAGAGSHGVRTRLPLEKVRGTRVRVEDLVKAENVAQPPNPWNGVEVMLHAAAPDGQHWAQQKGRLHRLGHDPVLPLFVSGSSGPGALS